MQEPASAHWWSGQNTGAAFRTADRVVTIYSSVDSRSEALVLGPGARQAVMPSAAVSGTPPGYRWWWRYPFQKRTVTRERSRVAVIAGLQEGCGMRRRSGFQAVGTGARPGRSRVEAGSAQPSAL
jgi:hypothetical protein